MQKNVIVVICETIAFHMQTEKEFVEVSWHCMNLSEELL